MTKEVQLFSETNKEFNNNLVVWQVFIWLFGKFSLGYLVSIRLVIWPNCVFSHLHNTTPSRTTSMQKYMKNPHTVPFNRIDVGISHLTSYIIHHPSAFSPRGDREKPLHFFPLNRGTEGVSPSLLPQPPVPKDDAAYPHAH